MSRVMIVACLLMAACVSVDQTTELDGGRASTLIDGPGGGDDTDDGEGCAASGPEYGSWGGAVDEGLISPDPYDFDAGIAAALVEAPASGDTRSGLQLRIEDAVVTNIGAPRSGGPNIWFADEGGVLRTYGLSGTDGIEPGDRVSLTITEFDNYGGELQISAGSDVTWEDADDPVFVVDQGEGAVDYATHGRQNIFAVGEITGDGAGCGGSSLCFPFLAGEQTFLFRIYESSAPEVGACVAVLLPLAVFNSDLQLNVDNFDWRGEY
jgi:hypothetical protein